MTGRRLDAVPGKDLDGDWGGCCCRGRGLGGGGRGRGGRRRWRSGRCGCCRGLGWVSLRRGGCRRSLSATCCQQQAQCTATNPEKASAARPTHPNICQVHHGHFLAPRKPSSGGTHACSNVETHVIAPRSAWCQCSDRAAIRQPPRRLPKPFARRIGIRQLRHARRGGLKPDPRARPAGLRCAREQPFRSRGQGQAPPMPPK